MLREFLKAKIHRATITEAHLHYHGSLTIDEALMEAAGLLPHEKIDVFNINNGERFTTYAIPGRPGSGVIGLNGAAARLGQPGDRIIIVSYCFLSEEEIPQHKPRIVLMGENNQIDKIL
ncbi:MAG: aspartate 1-decarboxylase [Calditrichaeota bacterium]|nr:MAG: aspartate 1-decarboxylase [Calditrichota bacterium]